MPQKTDTLPIKTILPWVLIALLASMLPYLLGWLLTPDGMVFSGILANHNDFSAYIAAMRQGAEGNWLFHFNFSPEQWQPQLMLPLYMVVGKLVHRLSESYVVWFNLLRTIAFVVMMLGLRFWVQQVLPGNGRMQFTAWLFVVFGGGLSWLIWPAAASWTTSFQYFPDIVMPEWTTMLISVNPPHYMFGLGLEIILFACLTRLVRAEKGLQWALIGALVALGLGLVYVYHTAVVGLIIGLYLLHLAWQKRAVPWRQWLYGGIILLPLLPLLFYYGHWVNRDPAWAAYVNSGLNRLPPPPILGMLIGLGLLGLFAATGLRLWIRQKQEPLVWIWLAGNLILLLVPVVQYNGRFALGFIVPVGTLAAYGLHQVVLPWLQTTRFYERFTRLTPTPADSLRRILLILVMPSTLMVVLSLTQNVVLRTEFPNYMPRADLEAAVWLAEHTDEADLILADYPIGNYFPAISNTRVFLGQFFLTLDFDNKLHLVEKFWQADSGAAWHESFIEEWGITHLFLGTYEHDLMKDSFQPPGEIVYDQNGVQIYRVSSH